MTRYYASKELSWRGNALYTGARKLAEIIPDGKWSGMWRQLTDMLNLTSARDAARVLVLGQLNKAKGQETAPGQSPRRKSGGRVPGQPPWSENGSTAL
jgi:hypothetical protein